MSVISSDKEYVELIHPSVAKLRRTRYIRQNVLGQKLPVTLPLGLEGFEAEVNGLIQGDFSEQFKKRLTLQKWHENGDIVTYSDIEEAKTCVIEELRKPIEGPRYARVGLRLVEKNSNTLVLRFNPSLGRWNRLCLPADYANDKLWEWNQKSVKEYGNPWRSPIYIVDKSLGKIGQTLINSGSNVILISRDYLYFTTIFNPLNRGAFNWSHDKNAHKISWEFYLDNDLEETNPIVIYDDDETFWSIYRIGSGSYDVQISEETSNVCKGSSSLKMNIVSGSYGWVGVQHIWTTGQNWSDKDFICLWIYGANSGSILSILLYGGGYAEYQLTDNWTGWRRLVIPLRKFSNIQNINLSNITAIWVRYMNIQGTFTSYLDRTVIDVGQWVKVEVFIPDAGRKNNWNVALYSWDGSNWQLWASHPLIDNPTGTWYGSHTNANLYFLNGMRMCDIMLGRDPQSDWESQYGWRTYHSGLRGETKVGFRGAGVGVPLDITYSNYYGCKKRVGFAIKMPPEDFQDSSTYGISQCKLKIEIYYDKGETGAWGEATYEFENSTNQYYGLQNINKKYIVLFHNSEKRANFIILDNNTVGDGEPNTLEVTADENQDITKVKIGWAKEKTADLRYGLDLTDPALDTNGNGIPDVIENVEAYVGGLS